MLLCCSDGLVVSIHNIFKKVLHSLFKNTPDILYSKQTFSDATNVETFIINLARQLNHDSEHS